MSEYFLLLERDGDTRRWGVNFGSYSRAECHAEKLSERNAGTPSADLKVIGVATDKLAAIKTAVDAWNTRISYEAHRVVLVAQFIDDGALVDVTSKRLCVGRITTQVEAYLRAGATQVIVVPVSDDT